MVKTFKNKKTLSILLAVLLLASALTMIIMTASVSATNSIQSSTAISSYGDFNSENYSYPVGPGGDSGNTFFNAGPAPNTPNIKYMTTAPGLGLLGTLAGSPVVAFGGKVFCYDSTNQPGAIGGSGAAGTLVAINAQTGTKAWNNTMYGAPRGFGTSTFFKVDDTHIGIESGSSVSIYSTLDGSRTGWIAFSAANQTLGNPYSKLSGNVSGITGFGGGSVVYWGGFYSSWDKMKYSTAAAQAPWYIDPATGKNITSIVHIATAIDCSNPSNPQVAWTYVMPTGIEALGSAPGIGFFGGYGEGQIWAINATTGKLLWTQHKVGNAGYIGNYYEGIFYQSASSTRLSAYNATTGDFIFDQDEGARAFFVFGDSLAYGMYIGKNIALPNSFVGAWDAKTGQRLWQTPALYNIAYLTPVVADGKVYVERYSGTAGGEATFGNAFDCFDAFTGKIIWELPGISWATPIIAYGNLYVIQGGAVWCLGDQHSSNAAPRAYPQFHYSTDDLTLSQVYPHDDYQGVVTGSPVPTDITTPAWTFKAAGSITGSAVAADGRVFFGSQDGNIYAINATNGQKLWNYTVGYRVSSTPCVAGGYVYTGGDDGFVYKLDATTGAKIWSYPVGGYTQVFWVSAWQPRSSPVFNAATNQIFVGALDGYLYCINAAGTLGWKTKCSNETFPIGGTPLVVNSTVYIAASDSFLYALNSATGAIIWSTQVQGNSGFAIRSQISTPIYDRGFLWLGVGTIAVARINATDGQIYNVFGDTYSGRTGTMTPMICSSAIWHSGTQYTLFIGDGFQEDAFNVTTFIYGDGRNTYNGTYYTIHGTYNITDVPNSNYLPGEPNFNDKMNGNNTNRDRPAVNAPIMVNGSTNAAGSAGVYYFDKTLNRYVAVNTTVLASTNYTTYNNQQTNGTLIKPVCNETQAPLLYTRWLGHQIYSSSIYCNDLQGPRLYVGDDVFSITCMNASASINATQVPNPGGQPLSVYATGGPVFSNPCIYNDTVFFGSEDGYLFAFRDPQVSWDTNIYAAASKSGVMWNNETITFQGKLWPLETTYLDDRGRVTSMGIYSSARYPNATVTVQLVLPDGTNTAVQAVTDNYGYFTASYTPTQVGNYSWIAFFGGADKQWISYGQAYTQYTGIEVQQAPTQPTVEPTIAPTLAPTETPISSPTETPVVTASPTIAPTSTAAPDNTMYIYAVVAVIIIIIIAVAAYMFTRSRGKKA